MNRIIRPEPVDREIVLDPTKVIMSKTNAKGIVMYANEYFMEICGYLEYELMGQQHNCIRHPDMPRIIYKILWQRLAKGENIHALVKNLTKDGRYYWVLTNFETKFDEDGYIKAHYSRRKAAPIEAVKKIEKIYKVLVSLEANDKTMMLSENYLMGMLEENNITYDDFILDLMNSTEEELQSYFKDPSMNLNVKETVSPVQEVDPIVEDKVLNEIIKQPEAKMDMKKKQNFFSRLFGK